MGLRTYEPVNVFFCVVILKCASTHLQQPIHMCAPAQQQLHYGPAKNAPQLGARFSASAHHNILKHTHDMVAMVAAMLVDACVRAASQHIISPLPFHVL